MKHFVIIAFGFLVLNSNAGYAQISDSKTAINVVLDSWHRAASEANFKGYFELMTADAVFIGTDAKENWNRSAFEAFAKPYFDKGKAWSFSALERHIYFDTTGNTAWFDELLSTQMKICRGSGVVVKIGNQWKIKHYVLSMTIPNENVNEVVQIKTTIEEPIIQQLRSKS